LNFIAVAQARSFWREERFCSRLLDSDGAKKALRSQLYQLIIQLM
jgi:hypothetical protein